jgi:hypothetical protein
MIWSANDRKDFFLAFLAISFARFALLDTQ